MSARRYRTNLFEIENARNMSRDEVVNTFVPVQSFWRMLSPKNHILVGSRGSGKTEVIKMLSHDHLSHLNHPRAQKLVEDKSYIGIYVSTKLIWVGGLKSKMWKNITEKEQMFQWKLNISSCLALLNSIESCLNVYTNDSGERARLEHKIAKELSSDWVENGYIYESIAELNKYLQDIEFKRQAQLTQLRILGQLKPGETLLGTLFSMDLFEPLRRGIELIGRTLIFPRETVWLLCLDEAEFLDEDYQRILNSQMRADSKNLFFKITTQPYCHYTLETNTNTTLDPGNDFEYIYLDRDRTYQAATPDEKGRIGTQFARELFSKRAKSSGRNLSNITVFDLLGNSELLDPNPTSWDRETENGRKNWNLLEKHASRQTIERANKLIGTDEYTSQIGRKIEAALLLRENVTNTVGAKKLNAYSGATMVMRCGDANPRRLIRLFNAMLLNAPRTKTTRVRRLSKTLQTDILLRLSEQELYFSQCIKKHGESLFKMIEMIGIYMNNNFYNNPITTDQIYSFEITSKNENDWEIIKAAIGRALIYPNISQKNPDELPIESGSFRLAYIFAPYFRLLPRRGTARNIEIIKRYREKMINEYGQMSLFDKEGISNE